MSAKFGPQFRGQYCFGKLDGQRPAEFEFYALPDGNELIAHRDLPVAIEKMESGYVIVIGFCFDYKNQKNSIANIAKDISKVPAGNLFEKTSSFVGRWVMINCNGDRRIAFSDAAGTFPLIYRAIDNGYICGSSSKIVAQFCKILEPNPLISEEFRALQNLSGRPAGQSFPLTQTEYSDIFALLPNHFIDLNSGNIVRYYFGPANYGKKSAADVVENCAKLLLNVVESIAFRYKIAYAATGGFDSRIIAGAISRIPGLAGEVDFFTFCYPGDKNGRHKDIILARDVAIQIGGQHRVIQAESEHPEALTSRICRESEEFIAPGFESWAESSRAEVGCGKLILMGWASEITRCFYRWPGSENVTPVQLADCAGVGDIKNLYPIFLDWLNDAQPAYEQSGIPILDLFYWENRVARWCGGGLNILNTGTNWMTIYSCRDLLNLMLSVKESDRGAVGQERFHRQVASHLHRGLSKIPINPLSMRDRVKKTRLLARHWARGAFLFLQKLMDR